MQRSSSFERDPCPLRVMTETGGGFLLGLVGGSVWHGVKGMYRAPRGDKLMNAVLTIARRAPRTAGGFGAWGGAFSILDCVLQVIRRKEDVWNPIMAGTLVGFILPMRRGKQAMILGAIGGFVILSAIEALQVYFQSQMTVDQSTLPPAGMPRDMSQTSSFQ